MQPQDLWQGGRETQVPALTLALNNVLPFLLFLVSNTENKRERKKKVIRGKWTTSNFIFWEALCVIRWTQGFCWFNIRSGPNLIPRSNSTAFLHSVMNFPALIFIYRFEVIPKL